MGNCNFKTEKEEAEHCNLFNFMIYVYRDNKKSFHISLPYWKRRFRKSVASRDKKDKEWVLCNERDVQSKSYGKEKRLISDEWAKAFVWSEELVRKR